MSRPSVPKPAKVPARSVTSCGADTLTIDDCQVGFPIRTSRDQRVLSPPPGLSQSATSFIASCCQGIHQTPFSRLIRSRRRRALLRGGGSAANPSPGSWSEVFLTRWRRLGRRHRRRQRSLRIDAAFSVSVIDLERLFLVSCRASRYLRTRSPHSAKRRTRRSPTRERPKNVSCFCSLHDVNCRISPSGTVNCLTCDQTANGSCQSARMLAPPIRIAQADWWVEEELNLRPHAYQACALTT